MGWIEEKTEARKSRDAVQYYLYVLFSSKAVSELKNIFASFLSLTASCSTVHIEGIGN